MKKKRPMKIETFKKKAESYLSKLETLIQKMPYKGDKADKSQKVLLQQTINEVGYALNGTYQSDLIEGVDD